MGLKRRAAGRKQVLDIAEKQDSPRRSWQTKYQQICVEHNTKNGDSPEPEVSSSSNITATNPLSGLLANYHSDSDGDEERGSTGDLDAKVSDFLKEIQTIVPSGSSIVVPGQPMTTPGVLESQSASATSAWQECYDETTGYIYYWHTETNDVTWETPTEYLPQTTASNPGNEVVSSDAISMQRATHQRESHPLPHGMAQWPPPSQPVQYPAMPPQPVLVPVAGLRVAKPIVAYGPKSTDRASSDSEDERIEMITSFGETSEEESEEEIKPPTKKKKPNQDRAPSQKSQPSSTSTEELIGPRLPSPSDLQTSIVESEVDEGSNLLLNQVDDVGPPGVESETFDSADIPVSPSQTPDTNADLSEPVLPVNGHTSVEVSPRGSEEAAAQTSSSVATPLGSDGGESADPDEVVILSRLRTQAQVLQELGGELPAEVRELMDPTTDVANAEEQQPELPDFEKEMERMEEELKQLASTTTQSLSAESSPKTTSFALIAGYGDDSDQEEEVETLVVHKRTFESLPTVPVKSLFPIADYTSSHLEQKGPAVKLEIDIPTVVNVTPDLPSPKISHSILFPTVSSTTEVPLPALRLQDSSLGTDEMEESTPTSMEPIIDSTLPTKAAKRKKRLDISTSAELVAASAANKIPTTANNDSSLPKGERKGFGFGKPETETDADSFLLSCMSEFELTQPTQKVLPPKDKVSISFVKGDVLLGPEGAEGTDEDTKAVVETKTVHDVGSRKEEEASQAVDSFAQLIAEKVAFLGEGREPTSPVQVMAIQIETLVSAWHAQALSRAYLSKWLGETGDELRRLETAAAPEGWACQWDRSHKRYYYYNVSSGETQWEYPTSPDHSEGAEENLPLQEQQHTPQNTPVAEDIAGGEQAMEICTTPPPSPSPPPTPAPSPPPPPPPQSTTPPPPPPPTISETRELSPPPPPRISPFPPKEIKEPRRQKVKGKRKRIPVLNPKRPGGSSSNKESPTPPPPDINPPLPPLPPPPSSPPPPPPAELPPLPASSPRQQLAYGEPLPPGVDPGELPYMPRPVPPPSYQALDPSPPPNMDMGQMQDPSAIHAMHQHAMQTTYVMTSYQPAIVQSGLATPIQGGTPVMDYSGMSYLMHTHMSVPAVIAKPPAKKHKAALHAALDSFYSDLATMGPPQEGVSEAIAVATPVPATVEKSSGSTEQPMEPDSSATKQIDHAAKKKKVKKVVGLGLKKRGVSSLVAKWQQVQQEVRRDFETLDQDDDSSFQ